MSLRWRCIGSYFSENDVGSYNDEFYNISENPFTIVGNGNFQSVKRDIVDNKYIYYFHLGEVNNGLSGLNYSVNDKKSIIDDLPAKIKFKARLTNYIFKDGSIEFFPNVIITSENINDMIIPCFSNGNKDDIIPFSGDILNGEWFDFEVLWADGVEYVFLNNICILTKETESILNDTSKFITTYDENFEIAFDIMDLQFFKMYEHKDKTYINTKITKDDNITLELFSNMPDEVVEYEPEYIKLEFVKLLKDQKICTQNIEIENCSLVSEEEVYNGMYCIKTYSDAISGNEFDVHVFANPCLFHSVSILNNYQHIYNVGAYDSLIILFSVRQNNIDLRGRILSLRQDILNIEYYKFTFNVYINEWLYSSVERLFNDVEFLVPDLPFVEKNNVYVPIIEPHFIKHKVKIVLTSSHYYFTFNSKSFGIQNCTFIEDRDADYYEGDKVYLNSKTNKELKVHMTDLSKINETIITDRYYRNGGNEKHISIEFESEGLELSDITFSYGAGNSGANIIILEFYFDDTLRSYQTLGYSGGTVTLTIPAS